MSRAEARIAVPVERLWAEVSRPGQLVDDHPYIARHEVERWPGAGSRDRLTYLSGLRLVRDVVAWHEGEGYDLVIGRPGRPDARVTWRVRAAGAGHSVLAVEISPDVDGVLRRVPRPLRRPAYALVGRRRMQAYVEAVVAGFRHHLERGEPVPRDTPRPHPWFSRRGARAPASSG